MGFLIGFLWVVYILVCFLLMFIILIQRGETGGLAGAFGGGGGETAFGVKADLTWKKATAFFASIFFVLSILLGTLVSGAGRGSVAGAAARPPAAPSMPAEQPGAATPPGETPPAAPAGDQAPPPPPAGEQPPAGEPAPAPGSQG